MSPHDMMEYRESFDAACARFGWRMVLVREHHDREWDSSWEPPLTRRCEHVWLSSSGARLFSEKDLEEGLVKELVRLSDLVPIGLVHDGKGD